MRVRGKATGSDAPRGLHVHTGRQTSKEDKRHRERETDIKRGGETRREEERHAERRRDMRRGGETCLRVSSREEERHEERRRDMRQGGISKESKRVPKPE